MDDNLTAQVRQRMRERDTASLLQIWQRTDGEGWSAEAYEIVRQTLVERGVALPDPNAPAAAPAAPADDEEDLYHSFNRVMGVISWAGTLSWAFLALAGLVLAIAVISTIVSVLGPFGPSLLTLSVTLVSLCGLALFFAFFFVLLQAISQALYLLLDIEDNTRQPERAQA